jgi:hypothetical protein
MVLDFSASKKDLRHSCSQGSAELRVDTTIGLYNRTVKDFDSSKEGIEALRIFYKWERKA